MRLKGFFWFLSILLTAVCVYQLSFTWVASNVENKAAKEAEAAAKAEAKAKEEAELAKKQAEVEAAHKAAQ